MDENSAYIQIRMKWIDHLKRFGPREISIDDHARAKDKTTGLVRTWMETKVEETKLRHETLNCITFTTKAKIEVHDVATLEALNTRIAALAAHRLAMEATIEKLSTDAPGFLCDLMKARDKAQETVEGAPKAINHQLGVELKSFAAPSLEAAMKSPRYLETKTKYEGFAATAKAKLAELEPLIGLIETQLAACEIGPATAL